MRKRLETIFEVLPYLHNGIWFKLEDWQNPTYEGIIVLREDITKPTLEELNNKLAEMQQQWDSDNAEYKINRKNEYPDFREYLDGIVKNDQAQIDKYIADCQAVKNKYPKE